MCSAVVVFNFNLAVRGVGRVVNPDEHHVLDAIETSVQRLFDISILQRIVDVDLSFAFRRPFGWRRLHQATQLKIL